MTAGWQLVSAANTVKVVFVREDGASVTMAGVASADAERRLRTLSKKYGADGAGIPDHMFSNPGSFTLTQAFIDDLHEEDLMAKKTTKASKPKTNSKVAKRKITPSTAKKSGGPGKKPATVAQRKIKPTARPAGKVAKKKSGYGARAKLIRDGLLAGHDSKRIIAAAEKAFGKGHTVKVNDVSSYRFNMTEAGDL